jgi:hypothetical protein
MEAITPVVVVVVALVVAALRRRQSMWQWRRVGQARSDGGLRSFASLVTRYVHSKAATTFADVADAVVGLVQSPDATVNEHNARRRVSTTC